MRSRSKISTEGGASYLMGHHVAIAEAVHRRGRRQLAVLLLAGLLLAAASTGAFALGGQGHELVTKQALNILKETNGDLHAKFMTYTGRCPEMPTTLFRNDLVPAIKQAYYALPADAKLIKEAPAVDDYHDLEFVDVEGGFGSGGRDNPHEDEWDAIDDEAHYTEEGSNLSAFNHFIDIKKGSGTFDDYDGYAYEKGSASRDQYQKASEETSGWLATLMAKITRFKVDEGLMWWFNDEYVHAPGQKWYRGCSPSVERYSFPQDKGRYSTVQDECQARFPVANSTGSSGRGIPYSVFMPIDNTARYWWGRFEDIHDPATLGPVMHAIQDACVPHHAAGYNGNWHARYERELNSRIPGWMIDSSFNSQVKNLVEDWSRNDPSPPASLRPGDWSRQPAMNWSVDQLVTWVALNAYHDYSGKYNHFRNGYKFDSPSARNLTKLATAMSILVLRKATGFSPGTSSGGTQPSGSEDCIKFDPGKAEVKQINGRWKIVVGSMWLKDFGSSESEARRALQIIQHYKMNSQCFVGRPDPSMEYYLVNGASPRGSFGGEDCTTFNPANAEVKQIQGRWKVVEGSHWILDFGSKQDEANTALKIIKKYGFTHMCFVGRPDPSMVYFRRAGEPAGRLRARAILSADPARYTGPCPTTIKFTGEIRVNRACEVKYKFIRSDGAIAPIRTLRFDSGGSKKVSTTWTLGKTYSGWEAIKVLSPVEIESNKAKFDVKCAAGVVGPVLTPSTTVRKPDLRKPAAVQEDCISFDPQRAEVKQINGRWKIVVGSMWLLDFGSSESEARRALQIIQHYRMNSQCFVGRPDASMEYYLVNGAAPTGSFGGEDCVSFNPANIEAKQIQGRWKVVEGTHWILDFESNENEANTALQIIQKYGFTRICFVGRPGASMTYFRK